MWSWETFLFYVFMSVFGCCLLKTYVAKKRKIYGILFFVTWLMWAVGRYIGFINGELVGGADAITYKEHFETCLLPNNNHLYSKHAEILFQLLTKGIRLATDDYHIYFLVLYAIILIGFMLFIKEFYVEKMYFLPLIMVGVLYIKSFSLIRGTLATSIILIGIVCLKKKKNLLCILLMVSSVLIQRASVVYAAFPVFYWIYTKRKLNAKRAVRFVLISTLLGVVSQVVLSRGSWSFFQGGAYDKYVKASFEAGFWIDYFKIIIDQVAVLVLFLYSTRRIENWALSKGKAAINNYALLKHMYYYDLLLIPFCGVLNIWRACDYFLLPRLVTLGIFCASFMNRISFNLRKQYKLVIFLVVLIWFTLRIWTMYDKNSTMPYYFELFV